MNAWTLKEIVKQRVPGFTDAEYLREVNDAYRTLWEEVTKLDDSYFTAKSVVTVAAQSDTFDLRWNQNGNLVAAVGPRFYQINRLRVQQSTGNNWMAANPRHWNSPDVLAAEQDATQPVSVVPPYIYQVYSDGSLQFARPLPANTQIEVVYNFHWLPLVILNVGSISSTGAVVTGVATTFTQLLGPDYQAALPGANQDFEVYAELIPDSPSLATTALPKSYLVKSVASDTSLTTFNALSPASAGGPYQLASVPDIPDTHHFAIASIATRNIMSTPAQDPRLPTWAQIAERDIESLKDTIMKRQRQENPTRRRFPYGVVRRARFFGVQ